MLSNLYTNINTQVTDLTKNQSAFTIILIMALILTLVFLACYNLVIIPQKLARNHLDFICNKIKQGDEVSTQNGNVGKVLYVFKSTIIIELENGCKTEVLKQSIKSILSRPLATPNTLIQRARPELVEGSPFGWRAEMQSDIIKHEHK
ncbi:MAG: preprotein translocase subunit YajC [bacterium]